MQDCLSDLLTKASDKIFALFVLPKRMFGFQVNSQMGAF